MSVVADTSPINYLLLIDQIYLLPHFCGQVIVSNAVRDEMADASAPPVLQKWIANPPSWLSVQAVSWVDDTLSSLDLGEQTAITLAQTLSANLLLIDERLGRRIASDRGIPIVGTIGILDTAAREGLIDLPETIARLQQTNFRISRRLVQTLLENSG